ncbi:hypothetical protein MKW92_024406 [Papaver armeniacum]|nr:hypothetical protein MKW92_024406 [Papaver armeniacum]
MVSKSSQVWLLLIFAILALYTYTGKVSAGNNFCPANNLENVQRTHNPNCGYDYQNCKQWCLDRGKWFAEKQIKEVNNNWGFGVIMPPEYLCVCCCKNAIPGEDPPQSVLPPPRANKFCPANNIEVIEKHGIGVICGQIDVYNNCGDWCKEHFKNYAKRLISGNDCVCCCEDATPPPPPPPCLPSSPPPPPALPPPPPCQECVCALNNKYCPANNIERIWTVTICGSGGSADFYKCKSWCAARGRSYTTNKYKAKDGRVDCVCCCGDALRPPPLPSQGNNG